MTNLRKGNVKFRAGLDYSIRKILCAVIGHAREYFDGKLSFMCARCSKIIS